MAENGSYYLKEDKGKILLDLTSQAYAEKYALQATVYQDKYSDQSNTYAPKYVPCLLAEDGSYYLKEDEGKILLDLADQAYVEKYV